MLLFSLSQLTAAGLASLTTESQQENGTVSTYYTPFDSMFHVDEHIVSAISTFSPAAANGTATLGQDFALCATHGCPAGTFMISDCGGTNATTDRQCRSYTPCGALEYEATPGNRTHDRVCRPVTFCAERGFQQSPPTASSDRVCGQHTQCVDLGQPCPRIGTLAQLRAEGCGDNPLDEFEIAPPTLTSDVRCQRYTQCNFSEHEILGSSE